MEGQVEGVVEGGGGGGSTPVEGGAPPDLSPREERNVSFLQQLRGRLHDLTEDRFTQVLDALRAQQSVRSIARGLVEEGFRAYLNPTTVRMHLTRFRDAMGFPKYADAQFQEQLIKVDKEDEAGGLSAPTSNAWETVRSSTVAVRRNPLVGCPVPLRSWRSLPWLGVGKHALATGSATSLVAPSGLAPSMRLVLADLAQPLVPHLAGGRRVACGRGGDELLARLGLGEAVHPRLDPGEPERHGAADLDPQGTGGLALRAVDGEIDLRITQGVLGQMKRAWWPGRH